ncbi:hypothetical protein CLOM621_06961 [Clostridium sp. M62/1]|nr:hypothetical protein CLOM621_06961 [Clostridium sp. M62/1]
MRDGWQAEQKKREQEDRRFPNRETAKSTVRQNFMLSADERARCF